MTSTDLGFPTVRRVSATAPPRPSSAGSGLVDTFGRTATDLRVSLTDRCNLRCTYCMPAEGLDWAAANTLLSDDELIRLLRIAVTRLGVTDVRFTGGEPLLRKGLEHLIAATTALRTADGTPPRTALTTNGLGLDRRAAGLAAAGLRRVNVSLDTLRPERFAAITRRDRLHDVLAGLAAASATGLAPVKVNTVLMRGVNDDEAAELLTWAVENRYQLRFIEQMPLDPQGGWDRDAMVTATEILAALQRVHTLVPDDKPRGSAPAQTWRVEGTDQRVGIIASVSTPFCGDCDRTRLTADGQVRDCLFARGETDLRALLRGGVDDDGIAQAWRQAMWVKRAGHGIDDPDFVQPDRPMSAIGG